MPDSSTTDRDAPASPLGTSPAEVAQVLEDAADYLLIHGVLREGSYGDHGGPRCTVGAIDSVSGFRATRPGELPYGECPAIDVLADHLWPWSGRPAAPRGVIAGWNDRDTDDDFEVIDTLRMVAKDLRNRAES